MGLQIWEPNNFQCYDFRPSWFVAFKGESVELTGPGEPGLLEIFIVLAGKRLVSRDDVAEGISLCSVIVVLQLVPAALRTQRIVADLEQA